MLGNGTDSERLPFVLKKLEQTEAVVIDLQERLAERHAERVREIDLHTERVAALESQLAAAQDKQMSELRAMTERFGRAAERNVELEAQLASALARAEEAEKGKALAERLAVWAALGTWGVTGDRTELVNEDYTKSIPIDGTPAGILAALRQAEAKGDE